MDWFVCGEYASISCGTWISFWGGAVGALVAAVLSALVALLVVRLTNAQQRHGVERTVEIAALADCVAALEGLDQAISRIRDTSEIFETSTLLIPMRSAVAKLQMSRKEAAPVAELLIHWPTRMSLMATKYQRAVIQNAPFADEISGAVSHISTVATVCLPRCTSRNRADRDYAMKALREADEQLSSDLEKFTAMMLFKSEKEAEGTSASSTAAR